MQTDVIGQVPVGISNRHVHLSHEAVTRLFGAGYELTIRHELSQPGQFAAEETVTIVGPKGPIDNVRILGPARGHTQVEISRSDGFALGVHPPVRLSGDIKGTPGITIVGPEGRVQLDEGLIIAARHIHMTTADAERFGLADGQKVRVQAGNERSVIFENVIVRVRDDYALDFHIDFDEGNAALLNHGDVARVLRPRVGDE